MKDDSIAELRAKAEQYAKSPYSETFVGHNDARLFAKALLLALDKLSQHEQCWCECSYKKELESQLAALVKGDSNG